MRRYLELSKATFLTDLTYRFEVITGIIGIFINMAVFFFLWSAIYSWNQVVVIGGLTLNQMITYAMVATIVSWCLKIYVDFWIQSDVRFGELVTILMRPLNYQTYINFIGFGIFITKVVTRVIPGFLIAVFIFNIMVPNPITVVAFIFSVFLGFLVMLAMSFITGLLAFWTTGHIWGFIRFRRVLFNLFAGSFIPLYFFPSWFKGIADFLPFQAVFHTPISIYIGKIAGAEILPAIGIQIFWAGVLLLIGYYINLKAIRRFTGQGG